MAEILSQVDLEKRFGNRVQAATRKAAAIEAKPEGFIRLPAGITTGVAQLVECYFGKNDKQQIFWRAAGKVVSPDYVSSGGSMVPVKGLITSKVVMFADDTFDANWDDVVRQIKLLAGESIFDAAKRGENVDTALLCQMVVKAAPYFRFCTELGKPTPEYPTPRVWERWQGMIPGYNPHASASSNGTTPASTAPVTNGHAPAPWSERNKPVGVEGPSVPGLGEYSDSEDLDSLAVRALEEPEVEQRLRDMAAKLGYTEDDCTEAPSWEAVVGWIKRGEKKGSKSDDAPAATSVKVGSVVKYSPPDQKDKKFVAENRPQKRMKACECKVTNSDPTEETCDLQRLDKKDVTYKGVPWSEVSV